MPARIVIRGKAFYTSQDYDRNRLKHLRALQALETKTPQYDPVPHDHPHAPFRLGQPYYDRDEGVEYRVVPSTVLDPAQGWGTKAYWIQRWNCDPSFITHVCQRGWLDAALTPDSPTRRYRCRDEQRCLELLAATPKYAGNYRAERKRIALKRSR
jgi:hypothetical protein